MKETFLGVCILFLLLSCQKEKEEKSLVNKCDLVSKVQIFGIRWEDWGTYEHDNKGRLTTVDRDRYYYYKDSIVVVAKDGRGDDITRTYYLDNLGRIVSDNRYGMHFKYNNEGYLVFAGGYTLKYADGNLIEASIDYSDQTPERRYFEYYDTAYQNILGYTHPLKQTGAFYDRITTLLIGGGYFGRQPKSLLKSYTVPNYGIVKCNYEFDEKGRIVFVGGGVIYKFEYNCK